MFEKLKERYHESFIILKELVKTDFLLRYQGSFLGIAWSVLKPLMLFCVMYVVFVKFLRFSDGTDTFPLVLLLGISMWNFFTESTTMGLCSITTRGDLLRKINFPKYIIVVSATINALICMSIKSSVVSANLFGCPVLGLPISLVMLSGGADDPASFHADKKGSIDLWDNCAKWILQLAEKRSW